MDFELTEEQRMVQETVRRFVEKEVKPVVSRMDHQGIFPRELVQRLAGIGLMGAFVPQPYGGAGMDLLSYVVAMEEISKAWAALSVIMSVNNSLVCDPIIRFGSELQKRKYLPRLAGGEILGCYALTEPCAGSDAGAIRTRARKVPGGYILNGSKIFITSGREAGLAVVFAVTAPEQGKKGISAFLVEKGAPGFRVGKIEEKMGLKASDTSELIFQDCAVAEENLLGQEHEGFKIALVTLDGGRVGIAAQALGIAGGCLEEALRYGRERRQFGRPIGDFQAIQWMIADMATEIEAARLLTYRAAWMKDRGMKATREAAQAKLVSSEAANRAAYKALQIFGGYGYMRDFPVERFYRDARITTLYEGTSEIQRLVIAREELKGACS